MKARILGSAAGGGLPQWNCGCRTCNAARSHGISRTQDSLAVSGDGTSWFLFNASADLRSQLLAYPEFAPTVGSRASPIRAVLLTSAEIDHTMGLLTLREADAITVYATQTVRDSLPFTAILEAYATVIWETVTPGERLYLDGGVVVTAFAIGAKRPRYATASGGTEWTIAYRIVDERTGGVLVYAPGLAGWTEEFTAGVRDADVVILDGTFAHYDEMAPRDTRGMGHLPIAESLPMVEVNRGPRYIYTHVNNTNSLAVPGWDTGEDFSERMAAAQACIATDGELLVL